MKPYTIVCTTCQARLRVRKAAAIGQILACPKCGSMVLIEPPPDGSAGDSGSGSAPEIAPAERAPSTSPPPRKSRFREDFPEDETPVPVSPAQEPVAAGDDIESPPVAPPSVAGMAARTQLQQWGILIAAGLAGIVLAIFVLALIAGRGCGKHVPSPPANSATASQQTAAPDQAQTAGSTKKQATRDTTADAQQAAKTGTQSTASTSTTSAQSTPPKESIAATDKQPSGADKAAPSAGSDTGTSSPSSPTKPATTVNPPDKETADKVSDDAPPGLVPGGDMSTKTSPAAKSDNTSAKASASNATTRTASTAEHGTPGSTINKANAGAAPPKADVAARLGMMILNEQLDHITLAEFAQFVSKLTALPVTLKMDPIIADGLTATTDLSVTVHAVTVKEMIEAAIKPAGLILHVDHDQLVITTAADENRKLVPKKYGVADLAADATQSQALGKLIVALIAPTTWEGAGGAGVLTIADQQLEISQTVPVHFEIACFLDRLRVARGARPLGNLPKAFVDLRPLFQQAAKALQTKLSIGISKPTPVADIVQRLSAESGLLILVDWQAVAALGITPQSKATLNTDDQPLPAVLNGWLGPAKLAYRVVDPNTLQISTLADVDARQEVQIYRLPAKPKDAAALEHLLQEARKYIGAAFFKSHGGQGELRYDAASNSLIASLSQPRQRALAQWLAERQTK